MIVVVVVVDEMRSSVGCSRKGERSVGYLRAVDRNGKGILIGVLSRTKDMMRSNMQGKRRPWVWKDRQRHANEEGIREKDSLERRKMLGRKEPYARKRRRNAVQVEDKSTVVT